MTLRWTAYRMLPSPKGYTKDAKWTFSCKIRMFLVFLYRQLRLVQSVVFFLYFGQNWPTQQRGLCDSWVTCLLHVFCINTALQHAISRLYNDSQMFEDWISIPISTHPLASKPENNTALLSAPPCNEYAYDCGNLVTVVENYKRWQLAMYCHLRAPAVAPVVLGRWCTSVSNFNEIRQCIGESLTIQHVFPVSFSGLEFVAPFSHRWAANYTKFWENITQANYRRSLFCIILRLRCSVSIRGDSKKTRWKMEPKFRTFWLPCEN